MHQSNSLSPGSAIAANERVVRLLSRPAVQIALLTIAALAFRLLLLSSRDYYDDEIISTFAARPPFATILNSISDYSVHPPFYYMLLHGWTVLFGEGLLAIRMLSVIVGALCAPALYLLGREVANTKVALIAALLMAVSPFNIFHSQQARMYPLLALLVILTALMVVRTWRRGGWLGWCCVALLATCGFYTHVYYPFSLLGLNLWMALECWRDRALHPTRWAGAVAAQALAALLFVPFIPQMSGTVGSVTQWYWIARATPFDWMYAWLGFANFATRAVELRPPAPFWMVLALYVPGAVVMVLSLLFSIRAVRQFPARRSGFSLVFCLIWTPIVVATALSLLVKPIVVDRSLIAISPMIYLLMAWLGVCFWRLPMVRIAGALYAASLMIALTLVYPSTWRPNVLIQLATTLAAEQRPGDAIVYGDWQSFETAALTQPQLRDLYVLPAPTSDALQWGD